VEHGVSKSVEHCPYIVDMLVGNSDSFIKAEGKHLSYNYLQSLLTLAHYEDEELYA
jgi:hypothetical protein